MDDFFQEYETAFDAWTGTNTVRFRYQGVDLQGAFGRPEGAATRRERFWKTFGFTRITIQSEQYWDRHWTGTKPHQRSSRLSVSNTGDPGVVGPPAVARLYDAMSNGPWSEPVEGGRPSNWRWREPSRRGSKEPGAEANGDTDDLSEVALERAIVATAGHENWTYQMSTSSGMGSKQTNKRRAIDLVTRIDDDTYRFTELKLNSNTPLFAVREILGYGLAYLHTRRCIAQPPEAKAWMRATEVELAVLAPKDWYDGYVGQLFCPSTEIRWLVEAINAGLRSLQERFVGLSRLSLELQAFHRALSTDEMARAIATAQVFPYPLNMPGDDRRSGA